MTNAITPEQLDRMRLRHKADEAFRGTFGPNRGLQAFYDRAALLRALDEAQAALQFYADPANHVGHPDPSATVYIETSAVDTDGGDRARAALGEQP